MKNVLGAKNKSCLTNFVSVSETKKYVLSGIRCTLLTHFRFSFLVVLMLF